jgi:hypothetical protein
MNGQWLGTFQGSTGNGTIIVNIDERETSYDGVAYTHPADGARDFLVWVTDRQPLIDASTWLHVPKKENGPEVSVINGCSAATNDRSPPVTNAMVWT